MKKKMAVFGGGGFGREVLTVIDAINTEEKEYEIVGFFDDNPDSRLWELNHLGGREELRMYKDQLNVVFAIGDPILKKEVINYVETNPNLDYPILVHPSVILGKRSTIRIGAGSIITANNVLTCNIDIGSHVILNLCCTVGHDTEIGNYTSFMPSVNISGEVIIGHCVYVGTGAKIINRLSIGEKTTVGAGAVVTRDLPANVTAVGVPAKAK